MIITIHLLVSYFIECYHFYNDYIHVFLGKKTQNMIQHELRIKHREQRENSRQLKKKYINTINNSYFLRLQLEDTTTNNEKIEIWKFVETTQSIKNYCISGHSCKICGNYGYGKAKDIDEINERYPSRIICHCE